MSRSKAVSKHPFPGLHQRLVGAGWLHRYSNGHHQYRPPPDRPDAPALLTMPGSPSDRRGQKNAQRDVRRWAYPKETA